MSTIALLYLARIIGSSEFGQLSLVFAIAGSLARLTGNPVAQHAMALAQEGSLVRASTALKGLVMRSIGSTLIAFTGSIFAGLGVWLSLLTALLAAVWGLSAATSGIARSRGREHLGLSLLPGPGSVIGTCGLTAMILTAWNGLDLSVAVFVGVVAIAALAAIVGVVRSDEDNLQGGESGLSLSDLTGLQISEDLFVAGDMWLLGIIGADPVLIGSLALAKRIAQVVGLPMTLATTILAPRANVSKVDQASTDLKSTLDWSRMSSIFGLLVCAVSGGALVIAPNRFEGLFGSSFSEARLMALVLIVGVLPTTLVGPSRLFLVLSGATKTVLRLEFPLLLILGVGLLLTSASGQGTAAVVASVFALRGLTSAIALSRKWGFSVGIYQRIGLVA